jgi:FAD/FMN-containing dehydrogenase
LIALSAFTKITLSADQNSVEAGPALNSYDMNSFLEPYGRIVVGGRLKTIGIAGLTIGGGVSYFTAKYGFAMDNVLAYDVMIASGEIVTASATNNSDLFWALKGGGSNFSIVTKFTFATYEAPAVSTAIQAFTEAAVPAFITAVSDLAIKIKSTLELGGYLLSTPRHQPAWSVLNFSAYRLVTQLSQLCSKTSH